MIALVEGACAAEDAATRSRVDDLARGLTIIFLLAVDNAPTVRHLLRCRAEDHRAGRAARVPDPTTIGALLSAIGIARDGSHRCSETCCRCLARAVEAAGDVQTLLLDKTRVIFITIGNRVRRSEFIPRRRRSPRWLEAAHLSSLGLIETEGRSIAKPAESPLRTAAELAHAERKVAHRRRYEWCRPDGRSIRKGASTGCSVPEAGSAQVPRDDGHDHQARRRIDGGSRRSLSPSPILTPPVPCRRYPTWPTSSKMG